MVIKVSIAAANNMLVLNAEPDIDLAVGITVQSHNIYHMPEFYQFWKESPIDLKFITANILQTPRYLRPNLWPQPYRTKIIDRLREAYEWYPEMERFITYMENNSPDELKYLWVQLDQNMRAKEL